MLLSIARTKLIGLAVLQIAASGVASAQPPPIVVSPDNDFVLDNRDLVIRDSASRVRVRLDAQSGDIRVFDTNGNTVAIIQQAGRNISLGGNGRAGDLVLLPRAATTQDVNNASVHLDGADGTQRLGGAGTDGRLVLRDGAGRQRILLSGKTADLTLGQEGRDGDVFVRDANGDPTVTLDGAQGLVQANQIVSSHAASGGSEGIDTASIYLESRNPAIGLRDTTGGNTQGWFVQAGSSGGLNFNAGDPNGLGNRVFVLEPDGAVCIGACN